MTVALDAEGVRVAILARLAEHLRAVGPNVPEAHELRPQVLARVLDDLTDCYRTHGRQTALDAALHRQQASEARLQLGRALHGAGLLESLPALLVAARRRVLREAGKDEHVADLADGAEAARAVAEVVDRIADGREAELAVPTGLRSLDEQLNGGLPKGEITLCGAPTGAGKTTLAMQIAYDAARQDKGLVLVVSPEMQARDLWFRLAQRQAGVARYDLRPSSWKQSQAVSEVTAAASSLAARSNLVIFDRVDADLALAMRAAEQLHESRGPLYLLVLDYAQQLSPIESQQPRYLEVGRVATKALDLAARTGCAAFITSQVNTVKDKGGAVVDVSFRESAVLEQKAAVAFTLRQKREERRLELTLRKNRHGSLATLELHYQPEIFLVGDLGAA